jgi:hypothetical protein
VLEVVDNVIMGKPLFVGPTLAYRYKRAAVYVSCGSICGFGAGSGYKARVCLPSGGVWLILYRRGLDTWFLLCAAGGSEKRRVRQWAVGPM